MAANSNPHRVALVHDWLVSYRGGEKVLEAFCELYPHAEIFTLFHKPGSVGRVIESHPIHVSNLGRLPRSEKYYRYLLPLLPMAVESLDLTGFDLVISTSHCVAKGVLVSPGALHLCYCLTPMRYAWDQANEYFGKAQPLVSPLLHYLRMWDAQSANRVDRFISLSHFIRERIQKVYRRDSDVLHPFADTEAYRPDPHVRAGDYYLTAGAFAPYKRVDLAIEACNRLNRPLLVVGSGQHSRKLKRLAGPKTKFLGQVSDDKLRELYTGCKAFLFPGEEDFGITPLEAMACGTPVIAYGSGGATETIVDGVTGLLFEPQTVDGLCDAILDFEKTRTHYKPEACRRQAEKFTRENFKRGIVRIVNEMYQNRLGSGEPVSLDSPRPSELPPGNA